MIEKLHKFLVALKLPVPEKMFREFLSSHPDFPSLLSLVDTLERFGIVYSAFRINKKEVVNLAEPFIIVTTNELFPVRSKDDLRQCDGHLKNWDGLVLYIDRENSQAKEVAAYRRERIHQLMSWVLLGTTLLFVVTSLLQSFSFLTVGVVSTAFAGLIMGYFLISKELGIKYRVVEALCQVRSRNNCDKILSSNGAQLFGGISLSDAVVAYFAFQLLIISFPNNGLAGGVPVLTILSVLTLPVIGYSIYYQYFLAKKAWCPLCLSVDAVLIVQFIFFLFYGLRKGDVHLMGSLSFETVAFSFLLFLILLSATFLLKSVKKQENRISRDLSAANRVKYTVSVFLNMLHRQKRVEVALQEQEVVLGNVHAPVQILMVSNLHCHPCKKNHEKIKKLLEIYPDKMGVTIRFVAGRKSKSREATSNQYVLQYWLQNVYGTIDVSQKTEALLEDWYETMDLEKYMEKYSGIEDAEESKGIENRHLEWIRKYRVTATPTFFLNGYEFPKEYTMDDLMYLMPNLYAWAMENEITSEVV